MTVVPGGLAVESDVALAGRLATEAGHLLVELRDELFGRGAPPWQVMDAGDLASHRFITAELAALRPDDAVLSEEGSDDPRRRGAERVWIVDPLDGTNEYGERGRSDWAVHVALWERGELTAAAVTLPASGLLFVTDPAPVLPTPARTRPRLITSRNRTTYAPVVVASTLGYDAIRLGSAGAKAMAVVTGDADVYVHDGGMYQWDSAAPVGVAEAAGLHVSRVDGSPIVYNAPDPWLPDVLICRAELAADVLAALRNHARPW